MHAIMANSHLFQRFLSFRNHVQPIWRNHSKMLKSDRCGFFFPLASGGSIWEYTVTIKCYCWYLYRKLLARPVSKQYNFDTICHRFVALTKLFEIVERYCIKNKYEMDFIPNCCWNMQMKYESWMIAVWRNRVHSCCTVVGSTPFLKSNFFKFRHIPEISDQFLALLSMLNYQINELCYMIKNVWRIENV